MELSQRIACRHTARVLERNGITTLEELGRQTKEDLLRLRGVGPVIARDLERVIEDWKQENREGTT